MTPKTNKAYLNQEYIIALILAIIPITNIILGFLYRFSKNNLLLAILNLLLAPLFYIIDLISVLLYNDLKYLV